MSDDYGIVGLLYRCDNGVVYSNGCIAVSVYVWAWLDIGASHIDKGYLCLNSRVAEVGRGEILYIDSLRIPLTIQRVYYMQQSRALPLGRALCGVYNYTKIILPKMGRKRYYYENKCKRT